MGFKFLKKFSLWQFIFGSEDDIFTTKGQFKKLDAVNIITNIGILIYFSLFLLTIICIYYSSNIWIKGFEEFIPSIAELTSVFIGIVLGFYWESANKYKEKTSNRLLIYRNIRIELNHNKEKLDIESASFQPFRLSTTSWDVYKEKMSDFINEPNSNRLQIIYSNIIYYNELNRIQELREWDNPYLDVEIRRIAKEINDDIVLWDDEVTAQYAPHNIEF